MAAKGKNLWDAVGQELRGSSLALWLFIIGVIAGLIGGILSYEDFVSSYYGIRSLETAFGVSAVSHDWVLYVMAAAPWVGQVAFIGLWTLDTKRWWALGTGTVWFLLDFISDVQYRSGGAFIPLPADGATVGQIELTIPVIISMGMTFLYFTVGAELFVTAATALTITLFPDAVRELASIRAQVKAGIEEARKTWHSTNQVTKSSRKRQRPGQNQARPSVQHKPRVTTRRKANPNQ